MVQSCLFYAALSQALLSAVLFQEFDCHGFLSTGEEGDHTSLACAQLVLIARKYQLR